METARAIDVNASLVQDRLTQRKLLARVAAGLFRAPSVVKANILQPLRSAIYAFKTDFVLASWIARLKPNELEAAQAELNREGFSKPIIRDYDDQPLDLKAIDKPVDVLMDIEPRNPETIGFPGRGLGQGSIIRPMLARAMREGKACSPYSFSLLRRKRPIGGVLAHRGQELAVPA